MKSESQKFNEKSNKVSTVLCCFGRSELCEGSFWEIFSRKTVRQSWKLTRQAAPSHRLVTSFCSSWNWRQTSEIDALKSPVSDQLGVSPQLHRIWASSFQNSPRKAILKSIIKLSWHAVQEQTKEMRNIWVYSNLPINATRPIAVPSPSWQFPTIALDWLVDSNRFKYFQFLWSSRAMILAGMLDSYDQLPTSVAS